jgi:hypothetical protein
MVEKEVMLNEAPEACPRCRATKFWTYSRRSKGIYALLVAIHTSRLASRDAAKSLLSTLGSESSGEYRLLPNSVSFVPWRYSIFNHVAVCQNPKRPLPETA